jgi:prophage endopeptidase
MSFNPMTGMTTWLCAFALAAGGGLGWTVGRMPLKTELATQAAAHATEKFRAAELAAKVLQSAQDRGDALTTTLAQRQTSIDQLKKEKRDALHQVTTGRTCLDGPALRLLNSAPGLRVSGLAPATSGALTAGGAAAAAADIQATVSTDTDIAGWAIDAGAQYEICRARLDALIDWHAATGARFTP